MLWRSVHAVLCCQTSCSPLFNDLCSYLQSLYMSSTSSGMSMYLQHTHSAFKWILFFGLPGGGGVTLGKWIHALT